MEYFKLQIDETGRGFLRDSPSIFNTVTKKFKRLQDIKIYLKERYGKMPRGKCKIYRHTPQGKALEIGFTHSFWNQDISHNSKCWFQTDWITISEVTEKPILLN